MEKRTILDQIEARRDGDIQLRFAKQITEGSNVIASEWHRTVIANGGNIDVQIGAVNDHLTGGMGYPAVGSEDIDRIKRVAAAIWETEV